MLAAGFLAASPGTISKGWKLAIGDSVQWASPTYNDQHWQQPLDENWERQGHPNYDGFGWYRTRWLFHHH
jgi:alpha-galactosidase